MRFCQPHWDKLRDAIKARGIWSFVATSGEQAVAQLSSEIEQHKHTAANYDPLMGAHWAIVNNAMGSTPAGLALLSPNKDGTDRCPLCYINGERHRHAQVDPENWSRADDQAFYDEWIDRAADDARAKCVSLGLLKEA